LQSLIGRRTIPRCAVEQVMARTPTEDVPPHVRRFAPKNGDRADPIDEAGGALMAMVHQATEQASETCDRATGLVDKIAARLYAVEDQIKELEAEVAYHRTRAMKAEEWLNRIQSEIQSTLLTRPE
jgi:hypothetical protein